MQLPAKYKGTSAFSFGDSPQMADSGLRDVIAKKQIATSGSFDLLNSSNAAVPKVGKIEVVLDGAGQPGCAIRITKVDTVMFDQVDEQFAKDEACESLKEWNSIHKAYFQRKGCFMNGIPFIKHTFSAKVALLLI